MKRKINKEAFKGADEADSTLVSAVHLPQDHRRLSKLTRKFTPRPI